MGVALQPMSRSPSSVARYPIMELASHPVEAVDAFEAEQVVQRRFPEAITTSLSPSLTDQGEIRRLFVDWLGKI